MDVGKKRKIDARIMDRDMGLRRSERRCGQTDKNSRNSDIMDSVPSLIPKMSRLESHKPEDKACWLRSRREEWNPRESRNRTSDVEPSESAMPEGESNVAFRATPRRLSSSSVESAKIPDDNDNDNDETDKEGTMMAAADSTVKSKATGRGSRKKRSVGSMEDLWDETIFEDGRNTRSTPIIKISFGAQGEGTVLKIPSKIKKAIGESETENEEVQGDGKFEGADKIDDDGLQEQLDPQKQHTGKDLACAKAAKRALKRAKKEARRKMMGGGSGAVSPGR